MPQAAVRFDVGDEGRELVLATRRFAESFQIPLQPSDAEPEIVLADDSAEARIDELEQSLADLGYMEIGSIDETSASLRARLKPALAQFLADARPFVGDDGVDAMSEETDDDGEDQREGGLSPLALELLRSILSFDAEIDLGALGGGTGEALRCRVLGYRLRMLNFYLGPSVPAVTERMQDALASLRSFDGFGDLGDGNVLAVLGDGKALAGRFARHAGHQPLVFRHFATGGPGEVGFDQLVIDDDNRFDDTLSLFERLVTSAEERALKSLPEAEAQFSRTSNTFGIELLQLGLWMQGYYEGRLDAWWGPVSEEALRHFIDANDLPREDVMLRLGSGFWAVNFRRIAEALFPASLAAVSPFNEAETGELVADFPMFKSAEGHSASRRMWESIKSGFRAGVRAGRRVALGMRSLFIAAFNGVRRGLQLVSSALTTFYASAKAMVKLTYRSAREALGMLSRSVRLFIHFVIGKPIVTVDSAGQPIAMSQFSGDRDAFNWMDVTDLATVEEHQRTIHRLSRGLQIFLTYLGKGMGHLIGILLGPVSWPRVAINLFGDVIGLVRLIRNGDLGALAAGT